MISYCVIVYNEVEYIKKLVDNLCLIKNNDEEIIIVHTYRNEDETKQNWYKEISDFIKSKNVIEYTYRFDGKFGKLKNFLTSLASKPYILNLDADENLKPQAFPIIRNIIKETNLDLYLFPRINIVDGITDDDIKKWSWKLNDKGWINWPDFQPRLYKNNKKILWRGDVHESLVGYENYGSFENEILAIIHHKAIDRQRSQNELYEKIQNQGSINV